MSPARNPYLQVPFLICVGVLAFSAIGMRAAIAWAGIQLTKYPLPLRKSLDDLDAKLLAPYQVRQRAKIDNLDILESLGTRDYIQWILEDPQVPASSPVRYCNLFITYYTGDPDLVPHVPEECYVGGGNIKKDAFSHRLRLSGNAGSVAELPVSRLLFVSQKANEWDPLSEFSVLYFFKVNGQYASGRGETRLAMSKNFTCKYSYFSKVEWKFSGTGNPSEGDILTASEKLMSRLLPLLETQHWPDWEKAKQDSASKP